MPPLSRHLVPAFVALGLITGSAWSAPAVSGSAADATAQGPAIIHTLVPSTHGNPEGVAADGLTGAFFVGTLGDGTIYRGTLGSRRVVPYIAGGGGRRAVGMKAVRGRLYVAGGATGRLYVFDITRRALVATFDTGAGGFLNDLAVTAAGDVWVTDSFRPLLWRVTAAQVAARRGRPQGIRVAPEIAHRSGFNLNGIVALDGGRMLLVVQSNTGRIYRIVPGAGAAGRTITRVDAPPVSGDGMLVDGRRLIVVESPKLVVLDLRRDARRAVVVKRVTDPSFRTPSTIARARDRYLVVNADFATSTRPFTVSDLPRAG
jgi:Cu-Zn family superoxide dismutase